MKENKKTILNIKETYSSDSVEEYTFTVGEGKYTTNVTLKLDIKPENVASIQDITKELVQYLNIFEEFSTWQKKKNGAIIQNNNGE